jgi:hypothetical protein
VVLLVEMLAGIVMGIEQDCQPGAGRTRTST